MSLVDSDHLTPTRRGRHGAHYKLIRRQHDGKLVPGMIYCPALSEEPTFGLSCGHSITGVYPNPRSSVKTLVYCKACEKTVEVVK